MLKVFKYLLLTAIALVVIPAGYFLGPFLTETTADNVAARLARICTGAAIGRMVESNLGSKTQSNRFNAADCDCISRQALQILTPPTAAQMMESLRLTIIRKVTGRNAADPGRQELAYRHLEMLGPVLETAARQCRATDRA